MSSRTKRADLDALYTTPAWVVRHLVERLSPRLPPSISILDPCSGSGALGAAWLSERPGDTVFEIELVEGRGSPDLCADFLAEPLDVYREAGFDLAIMNPSFEIAQPFVDAALQVAPMVASLQRLGSIESRKNDDGTNRRDWIADRLPETFDCTGLVKEVAS